ncbi:MAG: flagellar brake protein [Spirochaetota bacterium]
MDFFADFYRGFAAQPAEIVLVIVLVLLFVGGLTVVFIVWSRREARRRRERAEQLYRHQLERFDLTPEETWAIETMARHLHAPERKYVLLTAQGMYNSCAERALAEDELTEEQVAALRVKLGFAGKQTTKPPNSTSEIPTGAAVLLHQHGESAVRGRVVAHEPGAVVVQLDEGEREFRGGSAVTVLYQTNAGIFSFESTVRGRDGVMLRIAHDEDPNRIQRRQYYRKSVELPVFVRPTGSEKAPLATRFIDIGGGGASLQNPSSKFGRGTELELTFHPDSHAPLNLQGRVVRTSERGRVLHVAFEKLREPTRDKLFRLLFKAERSQ